jgi:ADP-ribosyl-[dinitrogen reductase] hydrolase
MRGRDQVMLRTSSMSVRDHARGALLGLAVGDALGTTLEFRRPVAPAFPELAAGPLREIVGGGPFGVAPGQVTDDTQMAVCLVTSLRDRGKFDVDDVARRYVAWTEHAFDIGGQTRAALRTIARGVAPRDAGRIVWEATGCQAAGNGSLMRTAPIGVVLARTPDVLREAARTDSAITHFDPRCQEACVALDMAIATAVTAAGTADAGQMWAAAKREVSHPNLISDLDAAVSDDPALYGTELHLHAHQGFVRVAFRLAFWELLHAPTFEAGLVDVVNRGGDADTNGAISGALLGAAHGEAAIPVRWRQTVLNALENAAPGPLRDVYHPSRLLDLFA